MYTKKQFGKELKIQVTNQVPVHEIGRWAFSIYLEEDVEQGLNDILITINTMEDGPEFAFTYDELNQIADDLIAGKEVDI